MKKRSFFRLGAVLLSASFAISGMNTNITRNVLAEEAPVDEMGEMIELVPETQEVQNHPLKSRKLQRLFRKQQRQWILWNRQMKL